MRVRVGPKTYQCQPPTPPYCNALEMVYDKFIYDYNADLSVLRATYMVYITLLSYLVITIVLLICSPETLI